MNSLSAPRRRLICPYPGGGSAEKIYFLPNEPKVVQCLPGKLKKQLCAKRSKTDTKPLKTAQNRSKPLKTDTKPTQMMSKLPENHPQ
jgi:hypothetical protein